jgi:hypothetical protein
MALRSFDTALASLYIELGHHSIAKRSIHGIKKHLEVRRLVRLPASPRVV